MESRKNGESAVEKNPGSTDLKMDAKKGAVKAPSGGGGNGAPPVAAALDPVAAALDPAAAALAEHDRFIEQRFYSALMGC